MIGLGWRKLFDEFSSARNFLLGFSKITTLSYNWLLVINY